MARTLAPWLLIPLLAACAKPERDPEPVDPYDPNAPLRERCFGDLGPDAIVGDYDPLGVVVPRHCQGTDHQDIADLGKVVFLGDSITAGTPPTLPEEYYRELLVTDLQTRFGPLEVADCSRWGARIDDLQRDEDQVGLCFPEPVDVPVLVVFTIGGNDMVAWGQELAEGVPEADVEAEFWEYLDLLGDTLRWFRAQEGVIFRAGVHVVFANVYEYTDGTNDVGVCPLAGVFDVPADISQFREGYVALNETYASLAVETQTDVLFTFEHYCGHGFYYDDPTNPCYRGPETEMWFDQTCIHPSPAGHRKLADMVLAVVDQ